MDDVEDGIVGERETTGELQYALDYARDVLAIFEIDRESTS